MKEALLNICLESREPLGKNAEAAFDKAAFIVLSHIKYSFSRVGEEIWSVKHLSATGRSYAILHVDVASEDWDFGFVVNNDHFKKACAACVDFPEKVRIAFIDAL